MTTFIDQLTNKLADQRKLESLRESFHTSQRKLDADLRQHVLEHWHSPLPARQNGPKRPGYAVDGSSRRANLVNGSTVFVAQALLIGEGLNERVADIEILPGTVRAQTLDRFADLMRQSLEIFLAKEFANQIPEGSILYLDGALYGTLPQLYPLEAEGIPKDRDFAKDLRRDYCALFETCERRGIQLISIAKTNRQALFSKIIQRQLRPEEKPQEISDCALIDELTDRKTGFSTPLLLGKHGFSGNNDNGSGGGWSSLELYEEIKQYPLIISFYVRLADLDDALRIDVPGTCVGLKGRIGDLDAEIGHPETVLPIVELLLDDYGGLQVYNALAYVSDVEVRLTKQKMYDIYLPMVAEIMGEEIRIDRSERRFVE